MSKYKFNKGEKVYCISSPSSSGNCSFLFQGGVYTVSEIKQYGDGSSSLSFKEDKNSLPFFWSADRFVPYAEPKSSLNEFLLAEQTDFAKALGDYEKQFTGEVVKPNDQGGVKFDLGKKDYTILLQDLKVTVDEVTDVLEIGAKKYARGNYKLIESERYHKALLRHVMSYLSGEINDPETGKHHLAHAICCAAFLIEREVKKDETV